jgi:glycosyltransferase involved in cell wall biosynthesis
LLLKKKKLMNEKVYCIVTKWGYPFGGGEEYMYDTLFSMRSMFDVCFWLSFSTKTNVLYERLSFEQLPGAENIWSIRVPGGMTYESIVLWLKFLRPSVVHHQGAHRAMVLKACRSRAIPMVTGYHFWMGILHLPLDTQNQSILENIDRCTKDEEFTEVLTQCHSMYCASQFMKDVVESLWGPCPKLKVISPLSRQPRLVGNEGGGERIFLTLINTHYLKGGDLFVKLIEDICNDLPEQFVFLGVVTEPCLDDVSKACEERLRTLSRERPHRVLLKNRTENLDQEVYLQTKVLLVPSLVDETFCRVAYEGTLHRIPVMASRCGNLAYLLPANALFPLWSLDSWRSELLKLTTDQQYWQERANSSQSLLPRPDESNLASLMLPFSHHQKRQCVMFFCPWGDQGLGIQCRHYAKLLSQRQNNIFVVVFSFQPYYSENAGFVLQKDPSEWSQWPVYYSKNNREKVTDQELCDFVLEWRPDVCLVPETCWFRIFQIAATLESFGCRCLAIPNIEIVRRDELHLHHAFSEILCNNYWCLEQFQSAGFKNAKYIGFSCGDLVGKSPVVEEQSSVERPLRFLQLGGMNGFSRKHIVETIESFALLPQDIQRKVHLTVTIQQPHMTEEHQDFLTYYATQHSDVFTIVQRSLTTSEIQHLFQTNDISIQLSKQEGLGLGFYEPLQFGVPVLTLNVPPHNEIIRDGINGWLVPATMTDTMTDNPQALYGSSTFKKEDLCSTLIDIVNTRWAALDRQSMNDHYTKNYSTEVFIQRFYTAIFPQH